MRVVRLRLFRYTSSASERGSNNGWASKFDFIHSPSSSTSVMVYIIPGVNQRRLRRQSKMIKNHIPSTSSPDYDTRINPLQINLRTQNFTYLLLPWCTRTRLATLDCRTTHGIQVSQTAPFLQKVWDQKQTQRDRSREGKLLKFEVDVEGKYSPSI